MKFRKAFSRMAGPNGRLVYRRRQNFLVPITIKTATITLDNPPAGKSFPFSFHLDGELVAQGNEPADKPFTSALNLRVPRGQRELLLITEGFEPNQMVHGTFEAEYGLL
jgi:hypothetical protein